MRGSYNYAPEQSIFLGYAVSQLVCVSNVCNMLRYCQCSSCPYHHWYHSCFHTPHALYLYCKVCTHRISSASFFTTFLSSPETATSITRHVPLSLSRIMMSGLFLGMVLPVCACRVHNVVSVPPGLVSADFGTWLHHSSLVIVAHFLAHTLCHVSLWTVLLPVLGTLMICDLLLRQNLDIICICYLFVFVIFLMHDILFVMPDPALLLFHCTFIIIIIIIVVIIIWMSLVTGFFSPVFLLNQRWSPPLRLQVSGCSTFRIMCDVPSIIIIII